MLTAKFIKGIGREFLKAYLKIFDRKKLDELIGTRVVFKNLLREGFLNDLHNKRILEIGPKHGRDTVLLANLKPRELVLIDLLEKDSLVQSWIKSVKCKKKYIVGNLLYLEESKLKQMGSFDLIWCLGVLYHNVEQLRLLKRLYDLCNFYGKIVVESATTRNKDMENLNAVEIHWPKTYNSVPTMTHLPSRLAIKSWLEMAGFVNVKIKDVYSDSLSWQRVVITAFKPKKNREYVYYSQYVAGKST